MKSKIFITSLLLSVIIFSCKNKEVETTIEDSGLIEIAKGQFISETMELGEPGLLPFTDLVHFTGTIAPSVTGRAQISLPLPGIIHKIYCKPGQVVNRGALLFEISGNEFVDLQKDLAESAAVLKRLESEFKRVKELYDEKIATQKEYILSESDYYAELAQYNALKIKLEGIGLDIESIKKGSFVPSFQVKSSISGYVASIDATIGQYIEPQQKIAEVIDASSFQLVITVFEKDINKVKSGQRVIFTINSDKSANYSAEITSVGKTFKNSTKSVDCYARLDKVEGVNLVCNQYAEGDIFLAEDSALSLPQSAIIESEGEYYILHLEKETNDLYYFRKQKVAIGRENNGFIELKEEPDPGKILTKGTYNILIE